MEDKLAKISIGTIVRFLYQRLNSTSSIHYDFCNDEDNNDDDDG